MTEPRASRNLAGHTQAQAAQLVGVARRTWQDWERGVAPIPAPMLLLYRHLAGLDRIPWRSRAPVHLQRASRNGRQADGSY